MYVVKSGIVEEQNISKSTEQTYLRKTWLQALVSQECPVQKNQMWNAWIEECCLNPGSSVEKAIDVLWKFKEGKCRRCNYRHRALKWFKHHREKIYQTLGSWLLALGSWILDPVVQISVFLSLDKSPRTQDPEPEAERRKAFTSLIVQPQFSRESELYLHILWDLTSTSMKSSASPFAYPSLYLHKQLFKRFEDEGVSGCDCRLLNTAIMNKKCPVGPTFATNIIKKFRSD